MKILKWYKDDPTDDIFEENLEDCLERTEGSGWYKEGTVKKLLEEGQTVETPFAFYKMEKKK